ncbi:hypothetical protein SFRURICE_008540 [Spodoptera frugiperda]|nr:hypothetical protein SFRURICE_008540 [Spodoptera frugiperda]
MVYSRRNVRKALLVSCDRGTLHHALSFNLSGGGGGYDDVVTDCHTFTSGVDIRGKISNLRRTALRLTASQERLVTLVDFDSLLFSRRAAIASQRLAPNDTLM